MKRYFEIDAECSPAPQPTERDIHGCLTQAFLVVNADSVTVREIPADRIKPEPVEEIVYRRMEVRRAPGGRCTEICPTLVRDGVTVAYGQPVVMQVREEGDLSAVLAACRAACHRGLLMQSDIPYDPQAVEAVMKREET